MQQLRYILSLALIGLCSMAVNAQSVKIKGIGHNNRYDDGDQMKSTYLGWNYDMGKAIFIVDNGIYQMQWNGTTLTTPVKEPAVNASEIKGNDEKELWASNFNMMYGNSGAVYAGGKLVTVMSRDESSTVDEELFAVRKWDAKTGNLISTEIRPKSDRLESAGMSYNPKDGKVYGLFYLTGNDLPAEITSDPDYFADQDDDMTDGDAGYALCTIDLKTMKVTPITPGLYYQNFITFAINSEGRAFALTSGGSSAPADESDGKQRDVNGNLTGAQIWEFNLETGLIKTKAVEKTDSETGETYTDYEPLLPATGFSSQYTRQAACFAKSNPNKMYWVGYYNSGKGTNEWGSWSSLSDKEWRTNGKYDTALYEIDITTGETNRLCTIPNRWIFSVIWIDGDDCSDDADVDLLNPGSEPTNGNFIAMQTSDNGSIWQHVEMGKQYSYYIEPADGWTIHSVTFNGAPLTVEENVVETPAVSAQYNRLIVVFEQDGLTPVEDIEEAAASKVMVLGSANGIHITGAKAGDQVTICGADGRVLYSRQLAGTQADIALKPNKLYIIKVADKVLKVKL
ncbi:MAG: hypothetical protein IJ767_00315 [Bacteroidaceae bacterium]|nr:hypothetical protein [Bacteroidaceae bacterium]